MSMRHCMLFAMLAAPTAPTALLAAESVCEHSESRSTPSPDGRWVANVQEEACVTASGGTAAGITVVLVDAQNADRRKRVFVMPVPRSREDWPRVRWLAADAVELRVANLAEVSPPEPTWEGLRITLAYCNDNPHDRARLAAYRQAVQQWQKDVTAWAQLRKQDAAAAGPRPPRPEEPRLSPGRCID
jgi:hypothetical protein